MLKVIYVITIKLNLRITIRIGKNYNNSSTMIVVLMNSSDYLIVGDDEVRICLCQ